MLWKWTSFKLCRLVNGEMIHHVLWTLKKHSGKRRKMLVTNVSLFLIIVSNAFSSRVVKNWDWPFKNWLIQKHFDNFLTKITYFFSRPCAMVVPDFELIAEIMLVAEGFIDARLLARKFLTLYSLCRELLSKQDHYDWGLRAIKSVLVVAGSLKRGDPDRPEDQVNFFFFLFVFVSFYLGIWSFSLGIPSIFFLLMEMEEFS